MWVDLDVRGQQLMDFFTRGSVIMHYELHIWTGSDYLKLKCFNDGFVSYKHAAFHSTRHSLMDWSFYQLFGFSFWWHPFTAEDPWASDVMLYFSKFGSMKKQNLLAWPEVEQNVFLSIFWEICSFKKLHYKP